MNRPLVFAIPVMAALLATVLYLVAMAAFSTFGATGDRYLFRLDQYRSLPPQPSLFIGDSQIREDIDCAYIGQNCANLGLEGMLPVQLNLEVPRIIATRPAVVVIGVSPVTLHEARNKNNDLYALFAQAADWGPPPTADAVRLLYADERELISLRGYWLALYERKFILPALWNMFAPTPCCNDTDPLRNPHGFAVPQTPEALAAKLADNSTMALFSFANATPREQEALVQIVTSLRANNIPVIIVSVPVHPDVSPFVSAADRATFSTFLHDLGERTGARVVEPRGYPASAFIDLTHVNAEGRERLSRRLAEEIDALQ